MSIEAPALPGRRAAWSWSTVGAYVALTKPRIIELLLVTTLPTMVVAQRGLPPVWLMAATLAGGALAAGGANAINMVVDRDIDRLMNRTKNRPLVTGAMTPTAALVFALALEVAAFVELWLAVNLLSAVLAISATLFYVFVYTLWLKRRSTQNIVIGGAAGAVPVLVGWAAVTDSLAWAPVVLFAIIFIWTPPHFWSLAVRYKEDYRAADVPMLPVVASMKRTTTEIVYYTVALVAVSFLFGPVAHLGWIYMITAAVLGAGFLYLVTRLWGLAQNGQGDRARGHAGLRVLHHLPHRALRGDGGRRTHLATTFTNVPRAMTDAPPPSRRPLACAGAGRRAGGASSPASASSSSAWASASLIILVVGLTTSIGTSPSIDGQRPHEGGPGAVLHAPERRPVRAVAGLGARPTAAADGTPAVLLFFGNWCPSCHQELPPLAAAVRQQDEAGGALARIRVIGVDSEDTASSAKSFIHERGRDLPRGLRPRRRPSPAGSSTSTAIPTRCSSRATAPSQDRARRRADAVVVHGRRAGPHSQRNVSAAASGAATAQTASTAQDSAGTAAPLPEGGVQRGGERRGRQQLGEVGQPARAASRAGRSCRPAAGG